ncbi:IS1 family transposase [Desulfonema magnum]|uniref:Transposase, IS1 family n=1 Tax=Desulfonema magnum TaxID=45655 RepID=A0A975BFW4_9BACT|nr:IS1 family transposase [Desulfonema magnum]QTA84444.1 Putative transposase, IS1 family [Desulfonema magnum]
MALIPVRCPLCGGEKVKKRGKTDDGKQRYLCQNENCEAKSFLLDYTYNGRKSDIKHKIIEMSLSGSGIRDIARVLEISTDTVISEFKKKETLLDSVNSELLKTLEHTENIEVDILKAEEAEADEMWSFVGKKENQRWLWHAVDHKTGKVLAYTFGTHEDKVFLELKRLLEPFGIVKFYTDNWGAYERNLNPANHEIGKRNTQKIERKHLTLRTRIKRLARKTICFSKLEKMHDIVIGLFINVYEFGLVI